MVKKIGINFAVLAFVLGLQSASAQVKLSANRGHSHNDYKQDIPLLTAYYAEMGSIEADVFLKDGQLYVAHEASEIRPGFTLKKIYLDPLAQFFKAKGNRPYSNAALKLQLVVDVKEDYKHVLPVLLKELEGYAEVFDAKKNANAIKVVVSGDMPAPADFKDYDEKLFFDGRPATTYTDAQLARVAMISDDLKNQTVWNGKGNPTKTDEAKMRATIEQAHRKGKPFRFWA